MSDTARGLKAFLAVLGVVGVAHAEPPGGPGKCSATEMDGTLIAVADAPRNGTSWDYRACRTVVRAAVKKHFCSDAPRSRHDFLYRAGDDKPAKVTVTCAP